MIKKYTEFINENVIEFLLEANIHIEPEFLDILSTIESPLAQEVLNLNNTELDVNTNYITFDVNKDDKILFRPDDKVEKTNYVFRDVLLSSYVQSVAMQLSNDLEMEGTCAYASNGQRVKIKEIDQSNLLDLTNKLTSWNKVYVTNILKDKSEIVIIYWEASGRKFYTLAERKYLYKDINSVKQSEVAVGRFTRALLKKAGVKFTDKEIEQFVTEYKTIMRLKKDSFKNFEIVSGDDIKYWYLEDNYKSTNGTMGSSCMRYKRCSGYLEIYCKNENQVSLIILKAKDEDDKICGRALLWTDISGRKFMDRIYINDSSHEKLFIEFAISNGYYYKLNQNYHTGEPIVYNRVTLDREDSIVEVSLENTNFYMYPYMDTMKYYSESKGILSSDDSCDYDYCLEDTNGGNGSCDCCGGSGECDCSYCDASGKVDCSYCDGDGNVGCNNCDAEGNFECETCSGYGTVDGEDDDKIECSDCNGNGTIVCDDCGGSGNNRCDNCDGDGTVDCDECRNGIRECPECT